MTNYVILGLLLIALLYELWTVFNRTPNDTISEAIWRASAKRLFIPFLAGFLCGHWFFPPACVFQ